MSSKKCVSTAKLCEILGVKYPAHRFKSTGVVEPAFETKNGVFWDESDIPIIANIICNDIMAASIKYFKENHE